MVVCIVAMIVFGIMGIFSAKYRVYAREAFSCVFRMVTFRPCQMQFDEKIRAKLVARLSSKPAMAGFIYKYFKLISWLMVIITLVSLALTAQAVYNLAAYGTCDPVTGDCIFAPVEKNITPCIVNASAPNGVNVSVSG